jgi:tetratricopeptide (TPR) repeat protein
MMRLALWCWLVAVPGALAQQSDMSVRAGFDALDAWQLTDAVRIAEAQRSGAPDDAGVQALLGTIKFHQGDYQGAIDLLQRAAERAGEPSLLQLAKSTRDELADTVSLQTKHFVIRVPRGKDEVLLPLAADGLEKAYVALAAAFGHEVDHPIVVDVLHDAKGLAAVSTLTVKEIETSGTIALCKFNRLMITSPKALARGYSWLDTLAHELAHLMISEKSRNNVPIWLHEGLAKYNESRWRGAAGLAIDPGSEQLLATAVKKKSLITFEQMHPSMAKLPSQQDTATAFAEVFTVVEFIDREKSGDRNVTAVLLHALGAGKAMDAALNEAIGMSLAQLQRDWQQYLLRRPYQLQAGAQRKTLRFLAGTRGNNQTMSSEALDEAAVEDELKGNKLAKKHWRLGLLLEQRRRVAAASKELEQALNALKSPAAGVLRRLAGLHIELGHFERAAELLTRAATMTPDDPHLQVLLGRVAVRQERWQDARDAYDRASRENPFHPEIYVGLAAVASATKDESLATRSAQARALLAGGGTATAAYVPAAGEPHGTVSVDTTPWGQVRINGSATPLLTPLHDLPMKVGRYFVRVDDALTGTTEGVWLDVVENAHTQKDFQLRVLTDDQRRALLDKEAQSQSTSNVPAAPHKEP